MLNNLILTKFFFIRILYSILITDVHYVHTYHRILFSHRRLPRKSSSDKGVPVHPQRRNPMWSCDSQPMHGPLWPGSQCHPHLTQSAGLPHQDVPCAHQSFTAKAAAATAAAATGQETTWLYIIFIVTFSIALTVIYFSTVVVYFNNVYK